MSSRYIPRLEELLSNLIDEGIDSEELKELQIMLSDDPEARRLYIKYTMLHSWLTWDHIAQSPAESCLLSLSNQESVSQSTKSPALTFLSEIAQQGIQFLNNSSPLSFLLLFLLFGTAIFTSSYLLIHDNPGNHALAPEYVAQITAVNDCQWSYPLTSPEENTWLIAGQKLQLEKGLVEITYANKAKVLLEGPVFYTIDSPKSGVLIQGKLFARADTVQARQFTIVTPNAKYVDLGTEFGVEVNAKGYSTLAVFSGKVNASAKLAEGSWTKPIPVAKGEAVACDKKTFKPLVARRSNFPSMQPLPPPPPDGNYQRWSDAAKELQRRPDLFAYYNFQPDDNNQKLLANHALTGAAFNGEIQNAVWVNGRFPGKSALDFRAANAGVRVNLPNEYRQMTVIAWVNSDRLANPFNGILMSDDWDQLKKLHFQIKNTGHINLNVRGQLSKRVNAQEYNETTKAIPAEYIENWCMIAGVIDAPDQCNLYVNGEFFERLDVSQIPSIQIGSAMIGGWNPGANKGPELIRSFSGRIDELMIFQSVLTPGEIKRLYEDGKP
jgi:hypothetical protein